MIFHPTPLQGGYRIEVEKIHDERGYFGRTWALDEFAAYGLETVLSQCNTSFNRQQGTLRGLHYQLPPSGEVKLVRCTRGALFDVMIDLRPTSPTFLQWYGAELSDDNAQMLYIPRGFGHGFQTLTDSTEIFYMVSTPYSPAAQRGARWNDPLFAIEWPLAVTMINSRDDSYPNSSASDFSPLINL